MRGGPPSSNRGRATDELRQRLKTLQAIAELRQSPKILEAIDRVKLQLEKSQQPTLSISPQTRQGVVDFLQGQSPLPSEFTAEQEEQAEVFKRLTDRGVRFCRQSDLSQTLSPSEALLEYLTNPAPAMMDKVSILTHTAEGIGAASLSPSRLETIDWFLERTQKGEIFYRQPLEAAGTVLEATNPDGMLQVKDLMDFLIAYNDPTEALVKFDAGYRAYGELEADRRYLENLAEERDSNLIEDFDDYVVVGGVVLDKVDS